MKCPLKQNTNHRECEEDCAWLIGNDKGKRACVIAILPAKYHVAPVNTIDTGENNSKGVDTPWR